MRAIAACRFTLSRFELWRCAIAVLTGCVVAGLCLWFMLRPVPLTLQGAAAVAVVVLASIALGVSLQRTPAVSLHWDGREWHAAGLARSAGDETTAGAVTVALDLGGWMLLQFRAHDRSHTPRVIWLPVQRRGLEPQWHGLRCAVYSPRPTRDAARDAGVAADL